MASNDRRSMGLRRLAKMLFTYRMPGFLSESRQPESTRLVPMWPGMRLRLIDSFPGQPCPLRGRVGWGVGLELRVVGIASLGRIVVLQIDRARAVLLVGPRLLEPVVDALVFEVARLVRIEI